MTTKIADVVMVMKPVDGGRAVIGIVECPQCGETHYTTQIRCGQLDVFCGIVGCEDVLTAARPDGWTTLNVTRIL
jgi:hypothetical protein